MSTEFSLPRETMESRMLVRRTYYSIAEQDLVLDKYYWLDESNEIRFTEKEAIDLLRFYKDIIYYKPNKEIVFPIIFNRINEFRKEDDETPLKIVRRILSSYLSEKSSEATDWNNELVNAFGEEYMSHKFRDLLDSYSL